MTILWKEAENIGSLTDQQIRNLLVSGNFHVRCPSLSWQSCHKVTSFYDNDILFERVPVVWWESKGRIGPRAYTHVFARLLRQGSVWCYPQDYIFAQRVLLYAQHLTCHADTWQKIQLAQNCPGYVRRDGNYVYPYDTWSGGPRKWKGVVIIRTPTDLMRVVSGAYGQHKRDFWPLAIPYLETDHA